MPDWGLVTLRKEDNPPVDNSGAVTEFGGMADTSRPRRARRQADKAARRQELLDAAITLFEEAGGEMPSVDQVARRAGLAKGTVYLYFGAKEEIFLALLAERINDWVSAVIRAIENAFHNPPESGPDMQAMVDEIVTDLADRHTMLLLAMKSHGTLDQQLDAEAVRAFKEATRMELRRIGQVVEASFPNMQRGDGAELILRVYAFVVGIWQLSRVPKSVRELDNPSEFDLSRPDFEISVSRGLVAMFRESLNR